LPDALAQLRIGRILPAAAFHVAALAIMLWSEIDPVAMSVFALSWGLVNCCWLVLLRRPALSAALSFVLLVALIVVSRFKCDVLWITLSFMDLMVIDPDTFSFLVLMFPSVRTAAIITVVLFVPVAVILWRVDPLRVRRVTAALGGIGCLAGIIAF